MAVVSVPSSQQWKLPQDWIWGTIAAEHAAPSWTWWDAAFSGALASSPTEIASAENDADGLYERVVSPTIVNQGE